MVCSKCEQKLADWHFWDADYCQECWEAHCSEEWWGLNVWQNGAIYSGEINETITTGQAV